MKKPQEAVYDVFETIIESKDTLLSSSSPIPNAHDLNNGASYKSFPTLFLVNAWVPFPLFVTAHIALQAN